MKISVLVCTLAAQLRKNKSSYTQQDAMIRAWIIVKQERANLSLLTFTKIDGTTTTRVVSENWSKYQAPKGTGKPVKEGLRLFADMGKHFVGQPCIISTYAENIVRLAA